MKEKLIKAFNHHQENYNITNEGEFKIEDTGTTIDLSFGNLDSDGFKAVISVFTIDNSLSRIIISDHTNYVETRDQEVLDNFIDLTGYFINHLHQSQDKLEDMFNRNNTGRKRRPV